MPITHIDINLPLEETMSLDVIANKLVREMLILMSREIDTIALDNGMDSLAKGYLCQKVFAQLSGEVWQNDHSDD